MSQFGRPSSDISNNGWSTAPLFSKLNETTDVGDATSITASDGLSPVDFEVKLGSVTDPVSSSGHVIRIRLSGTFSANDFTVLLKQGATTKATFTAGDGSGGFSVKTYILTGVEADSITDYTDLRVVVSCGGGLSGANFFVSRIEMESPDPVTPTLTWKYLYEKSFDVRYWFSTFKTAPGWFDQEVIDPPPVVFTGTVTTGQGSESVNANALLIFTGANTSGQGSQTVSATGLLVFTGTDTSGQGSQSVSANALLQFIASATSGQGSESVSANALLIFTGTNTSGQGSQSVNAAASLIFTGTVSSGQDSQSVNATALEIFTGPATSGQGSQSVTSSALLIFTGSTTAGQGSQTVDSTDLETFVGSATTGQGTQTADSSALLVFAATAQSGQGSETVDATALLTFTSAVDTAQGSQTVDAIGEFAPTSYTGDATSGQGSQTADATSFELFSGTADSGQGSQSVEPVADDPAGVHRRKRKSPFFQPLQKKEVLPLNIVGRGDSAQEQEVRGKGKVILVGSGVSSQSQDSAGVGSVIDKDFELFMELVLYEETLT